jgi:8-oxo-dGTP diphosphatase
LLALLFVYVVTRMNRARACAAVLKDDKVLMVCHQTATQTFWTLPGGGQQEGETLEQTAMREVMEETGLDVKIIQFLFEEDYEDGKSYCYHAKLAENETVEPTFAFLPKEELLFGTMLHAVVWHPLNEQKADFQISKVISILNLDHS